MIGGPGQRTPDDAFLHTLTGVERIAARGEHPMILDDRGRLHPAIGGGLEGPGAIVSGGMLYFNSGYGGFVGNPGNVLLAFGVD